MKPVEEIYLDSLKSLLKKGEIEKAIDDFEKLAKKISNKFHNDIIHQSARFYGINRDRNKGIITDESYRMHIARINYALLDLIDTIPTQDQINATRLVINSKSSLLSTLNLDELEKIIGKEELFEINWLRKAINASNSVCKVLLPSGGSGTGFVLNGGYLLTNNHVLKTSKQAQNAKIIFNFQIDENGNQLPTKEYTLDESFFLTSRELDYSLVKIKDDETLFSWGHLKLEKFLDAQKGERVNIIQHPDGGTMKLALPDKIISKWNSYLFYLADTKPGSSGSPVFNQEWKVIALHHAGKISGGGLQINAEGEHQPSNRGILIKEILKDIKSKGNFDTIINNF